MPNDSLTSILQAICGDDVSARTLLGNPSFLKLCTVLAEQLAQRFRQTVLLENAARRPGAYDELDGSSFKNELHEALERDS
jgi:hypothetical protein